MITDAEQILFRHEVRPQDVETVGRMVAATRVFNEAEEGIAIELVEDRLQKKEESEYLFLFAERGGHVVGYTCYGPIPGTHKRYDIYWIAIDPPMQRRGLGRRLLQETEQRISALAGQRIYVETSSKQEYAPTRRFYAGNGYVVAGQIRDYHDAGDDLVIYVKDLSARPVTEAQVPAHTTILIDQRILDPVLMPGLPSKQ